MSKSKKSTTKKRAAPVPRRPVSDRSEAEPELLRAPSIEERLGRKMAARMAKERIMVLTSGSCFHNPQEWDVEFEQLKKLLHGRYEDQFNDTKKCDHGLVREDIAAEAGFLLGLEIGKRINAGGAR